MKLFSTYLENGDKNNTLILLFHKLAFFCVCGVAILGPWAFSAWEMWWFWPIALLLFAGVLFAGVGSIIEMIINSSYGDTAPEVGYFIFGKRKLVMLISIIPFIAYAIVRFVFHTDTQHQFVYMDGERSLLLFITPVLLAVTMLLVCTRKRLVWLCFAILINMFLVAIYSIINHYVTNDTLVLWFEVPRSMWYGGRATGVFFCPNHLSAFMNFGIIFSIAILLTPRKKGVDLKQVLWLNILAATVLPFLLWANVLTLSRGGMASLFVALVVGLSIFGFSNVKPLKRIGIILGVIISAVLLLVLIFSTENIVHERCKKHGFYKLMTEESEQSFGERLHETFWYGFDRGWYIGSALRAWESNPVWGIGPGQHSSRWGEFAATPDGTREPFKAPKMRNDGYHLYEVHSDWTQLLEEYGIVGIVLFIIPMLTIFGGLINAKRQALKDLRTHSESHSTRRKYIDENTSIEAHHKANDDSLDENIDEAALDNNEEHHHKHHRKHRKTEYGFATLTTPAEFKIAAALPLAALLMCICMIFHSIGDFSFQIPTIVWTFAIFIASALMINSEIKR
ncbi:MAG: O-antigen ligase family protein [Kiritimatiellae bacterium]|nr:O-antigen ligase family protein [Kiritimatiellia bacterium]